MKDLAAITGQKPVPTKARTSIASFKLREGMVIGAKVTLRKDRMYEFLDRLITIALPRVKDFRGLQADQLRRPRQLRAWACASTSCSRRSTTTRSTRSGAWTSSSAPPRSTDDEARALLTRIPIPVHGAAVSGGRKTDMAKKSAVNRNEMVRRLVQADGRQAQRAEGDRQRREPVAGGALRRAPEARRAAAQLVARPASATAAR